MDRLPGIPLIAAGLVGMDRALLDAQLRLHGLDPAPLARALGDAVSFEGYLTRFERRVDQGALDGLRAAMAGCAIVGHRRRPWRSATVTSTRRTSSWSTAG